MKQVSKKVVVAAKLVKREQAGWTWVDKDGKPCSKADAHAYVAPYTYQTPDTREEFEALMDKEGGVAHLASLYAYAYDLKGRNKVKAKVVSELTERAKAKMATEFLATEDPQLLGEIIRTNGLEYEAKLAEYYDENLA